MSEHITKDGTAFFIRKPHENDAEKIIQYSKLLFASTDQVLTTPEEYTISVEDEKAWISKALNNSSATTLVATMNEEIIGLLFFVPMTKIKNRHTGEFGVSVHPNHQGRGVGRALIKSLLNWANENDRIEKVFFECFCNKHNSNQTIQRFGIYRRGQAREGDKTTEWRVH